MNTINEIKQKTFFTKTLRAELAQIKTVSFTCKDLLVLLTLHDKLPNGKDPIARIAHTLKYLEDGGYVEKVYVGQKGKRDPHRFKTTEKCIAGVSV